jgi:hypothetical protein
MVPVLASTKFLLIGRWHICPLGEVGRKRLEDDMTTLKRFLIAITLLAGCASLAMAQNGPPTGSQSPVAGGANGGRWGWYAGGAYGYPYSYRYRTAYGYGYRPYRYWGARRQYHYRGVGFY